MVSHSQTNMNIEPKDLSYLIICTLRSVIRLYYNTIFNSKEDIHSEEVLKRKTKCGHIFVSTIKS